MSVKPVAWKIPKRISTEGAVRHNVPAEWEGLVGWELSFIGDANPIKDKHGVTHSPIPLYDAPAPELAEALRTYISHYPAFRSKPVGAPGSQAREKQEYEIALEDEAISLLARITPK